MSFEEFMYKLDEIWDKNQKQVLKGYKQFSPKNIKIKVCTNDDSWAGAPGSYVSLVAEGIDFDDGNILIYTDKPLYLERSQINAVRDIEERDTRLDNKSIRIDAISVKETRI